MEILKSKKEKFSNCEIAMTGKGSDINGKGGAAMSMRLKLKLLKQEQRFAA